MDFYRSKIIFLLVLCSSCTTFPVKNNRNNYYRTAKFGFANVEIRFGEGHNEKCVVILTSEGMIVRSSPSLYDAKNRYNFIPILELDSNKVGRLQRLIISNNYLAEFDSCFCEIGSGLVTDRLTLIGNPKTLKTKLIVDRNYPDLIHFPEQEVSIDRRVLMEVWDLIIDLIPQNIKKRNDCWE